MSTSKSSGRKFAIVTYIDDTAEVLSLLNKKRTMIRAYAVILHDKDEADRHHHIVLRTHNPRTCLDICKWFADNKAGQNTFAQFVHDDGAILDYLTHKDEPDKYQYSEDDIIDGGLSDLLPDEGNTDDPVMYMVDDLVRGVPIRTMVQRYGKLFVYHYGAIVAVADAIRCEDATPPNETPLTSAITALDYTKLAFCIIRPGGLRNAPLPGFGASYRPFAFS